ncbi:MAG: hypothetical protein ABS84_04205 [Rubrivivax sp. SCN 71-131]|jgi:hypothetical protein|nr:MAG: hypothetical protein ABS84_04205 [Rubrivivax sp. SCN 71-131]
MNPLLGWGLAAVAVVGGFLAYGWQGLVLALTMIVFWLLLQFGRALRAMRDAAARPLGTTDNALMLHARLRPGMRLLQILPLAGSLGQKVGDDPETFLWTDVGGDLVRVQLRGGRLVATALERAAAAAPGETARPT